MLIEARKISKSYGSGQGAIVALQDASLEITRGEFVAIMGPSGSGKSSLMNLIALLDQPSSGELLFRGQDVTRLSADAKARLRNRHVGFVFQSYHLMPRRSAIANVELPLAYRGLGGRARLVKAKDALEKVGLSSRMRALPPEMSGGEQQRVAIARALVADPDLIVADEPTGALDTDTGAQILELFGAACADGRTVLLVTHDPVVAARAARQISIQDGRVQGEAMNPETTVQSLIRRFCETPTSP